jgi:membrane peptidoglycan carboxypeptidase
MKIKKIQFITEESKDVAGITFENSTEDQFPYVESAINSLDNNFKWWKENWEGLEQILSQKLQKSLKGSTNLIFFKLIKQCEIKRLNEFLYSYSLFLLLDVI